MQAAVSNFAPGLVGFFSWFRREYPNEFSRLVVKQRGMSGLTIMTLPVPSGSNRSQPRYHRGMGAIAPNDFGGLGGNLLEFKNPNRLSTSTMATMRGMSHMARRRGMRGLGQTDYSLTSSDGSSSLDTSSLDTTSTDTSTPTVDYSLVSAAPPAGSSLNYSPTGTYLGPVGSNPSSLPASTTTSAPVTQPSIISNLMTMVSGAFSTIGAFNTQQTLIKTNAARAAAGLPPLDISAVSPQVNVGLSAPIMTLLQWGLIGGAILLVVSKMGKRS
jgi:hypothetical protein